MYLKDVNTFQELEEYISVLKSILDIIDEHKFSDHFNNTDFNIVKVNNGIDGYSFRLLKNGVQVVSIGFYNLENDDIPWVNYRDGYVSIFGFQQELHTSYTYCTNYTDNSEEDVPFYDYSEEMFTQLEFLHPPMHIKGGMVLSKLGSSDPNRKYRQFVIYESKNIDFIKILKEMEQIIHESSNVPVHKK